MALIRHIFIPVLLTHILLAQTLAHKCGRHEEYKTCGSACVETCDYIPTICTKQCVSGCFCQDGYVRESDKPGSACVKREECGVKEIPKCGRHEEYNTCGSACVETCDYIPTICTKQCVSGCFCQAGYVRGPNNACIKREECGLKEIPKCGRNEEYNTCGSDCVENCDYVPTICTKRCMSGCFCQEGYVRESNKTGSACIKREECESKKVPKCGKNEQYYECRPMCAKTCYNFQYPLPKPEIACKFRCTPGCYCKPGFYMRDDGKCVRPEKCCGDHEEYDERGTACPETCDGAPEACTEQCVAGCFCHGYSHHYVRLDDSEGSPCVRRRFCWYYKWWGYKSS